MNVLKFLALPRGRGSDQCQSLLVVLEKVAHRTPQSDSSTRKVIINPQKVSTQWPLKKVSTREDVKDYFADFVRKGGTPPPSRIWGAGYPPPPPSLRTKSAK